LSQLVVSHVYSADSQFFKQFDPLCAITSVNDQSLATKYLTQQVHVSVMMNILFGKIASFLIIERAKRHVNHWSA